jgi:hypothetical protein
MKEVYEGQINDQLASEQVTLKRIEAVQDGVVETVGGKYIVFPVRFQRNHGISYRAENTQLAAAQQQGYAAAQEFLKYGYQRVKLTGQVMDLANKNFQAFSSALDREVDGARLDVARDQNRICYGTITGQTNNKTGLLASASAISSGTTITFTAGDTYLLEPGMVIDIVDPATGTPVSGGTGKVIQSVTNTTIVVDSAVAGVIVGSTVVRTGNYNAEPYGLTQIVSATGALHNLNPATAGQGAWASTIDSTTTTLTENSMVAVCDNVYKASGKRVTAIFSSLGVRRSYFGLMQSLRRYNEPKEFSGGLIGLAFNYGKEIPVVADMDVPAKNQFFLTESEIKMFRSKPWYWEDVDGSVWKYVHDYDVFEALLKCYWQLGTHQRNAHGRQTNVTES